MINPFIIAIDGPSASGKGTIARRLAEHFDFAHLDTGLLYRAVGWAVVQAGQDPADTNAAEQAARNLDPAMIAGLTANPALRQDHVSIAASKVAAIPAVRAALLKFQQDFCATPPSGKKGAVLDGRDIGTVIAPDAPVKIYITANAKPRAERRFKELQSRGEDASYAAVLADMMERDARDAQRSTAPAQAARDAVILDTTTMTAADALAEAVHLVESKMGYNR